jgi:hypothetical protein
MKKILSITSIILIVLTASAQQPYWQWVKSGGSAGFSSNNWKESCVDMGTDAHGNVYGISYIFNTGIVVDTVQKPQGFGYEDFCVFSYTCDGSFRWVKFFGSCMRDKVGGIAVDGEGNVYISGIVVTGMYGNGYFGDSIVPQSTDQRVEESAIVKLDSSGQVVWLNLPDLPFDYTYPKLIKDVELDNQGNLCVMVKLFGTTTWDSIAVPEKGWYIAKFDKDDGRLFELVPLQYKDKYNYNFFSIDTDNSIYMMSAVADTIIMGNDTIFDIDTVYQNLLIKFSPNGNKVWYTEIEGVPGTDSYQSIWGKPLLYNNSLYIGGRTQSYSGSNFFGVPIINPVAYQPPNYTKVIACFNKYTGDFVSVINLQNKNNIFETPLTSYNNRIIAAGDAAEFIIINQSDTIKPHTPPMNSTYPFIVEIDTALTHFNWGIATEAVGIPSVEVITTDNNGNIYLGGSMEGSIFNSFGDETFPAAGGGDFMIAKVALTNNNCGCAYAVPQAQLISFVNDVLTVKGNVTNTADSLVWYWGDGSSTVYTTPGTNITHTYQSPGTYTIYLRAWNICGMKEDSLVNLTSGINTLNRNGFSMTYYPNPFTQTLTIEFSGNLGNAELHLYGLMGKDILTQQLNGLSNTINTSQINNGIYIMKVVSGDGDLFIGKVVKGD